ncbi:MAG: phage tail sheath protein [Oscillospiraceae bacterium]|nr:phage tail sheath protein [Oscillospiraceae bacterium]
MPYEHGAYAVMGGSVGGNTDLVSGLPVYVGALPVHLTGLPPEGLVNKPVLLRNMADAERLVGYSDSWDKFSLCEALSAHFDNRIQNVGPIVVINVLDPKTMKKAGPKTAQVALVGGRGLITDDECIVGTVEVAGKVAGVDFTVRWSTAKQAVEFRDLTGEMTSPVTVTYDQVDLEQVTAAEVIGNSDPETGVYTGIRAMETVYQLTGSVPTMLCAPAFSSIPAVRLAMLAAADRADGHWYAHVLTDIPTDGVSTISEAIQWKADNAYNSAAEVTHWPKARRGGKVYHLSTLSVVAAMRVDATHSGVPMETPSNKPADIDGYYISGSEANFTSTQANLLNQNGIRTVAFTGGRWAMWGPHTAAFVHGDATPLSDTYDNTPRMLYFLANWFQVQYAREIGAPINNNRVDAIINEVRAYLDGLRTLGALLYADIEFEPIQVAGDLVTEGRFSFFSTATPTPPVRAYVLTLAYNEGGLSAYANGGVSA